MKSVRIPKVRGAGLPLSIFVSHALFLSTGELNQLEECIHICESLIDNVSMYANWWSCIQLETRAQVGKADQFQLNKNVLKSSSMNRKASIRKWNEMKRKFSNYTVEVGKVLTHFRLPSNQYLFFR